MNTSSLVLGIVALILIGLGAWWFLRGREQGSTTPPRTPKTTTSCLPKDQLEKNLAIEYRNGKFFAKGGTEASDAFCLPKSGTVTFTGSNLWVASDPHPIHTDLPGFDPRKVQESFSFTFDRVGEWGFHNHLRPSDTGTIIVVE